MDKTSNNVESTAASGLGRVDLHLLLTRINHFVDLRNRLQHDCSRFASVTIAAPMSRPSGLPESVGWHSIDGELHRAAVRNEYLKQGRAEWTLFLEDNEELDESSLPDLQHFSPDRWPPVLITVRLPGGIQRDYYQLRLVPNRRGVRFDGINLPDASRYALESGIEFSEKMIRIVRIGDPGFGIETDLELQDPNPPALYYLQKGEELMRDGRYAEAAARYRHLLKREKLLAFDRLAAVNGLAGAYAEQYKWDRSLTLAQKSIDAQPLQRTPYLIQYRLKTLKREWSAAAEALRNAFEMRRYPSRANFDRTLGVEEELSGLAEMERKAGRKREALEWYDRLYRNRKGALERAVIHRMLLMALEVKDFDRSRHYVQVLYGRSVAEKKRKENAREFHEIMGLFMKCGWYDYVSDVYTELCREEPANREYRRRLIVALTKTDRLEMAKHLIAGHLP